jgi:hypothetical protein
MCVSITLLSFAARSSLLTFSVTNVIHEDLHKVSSRGTSARDRATELGFVELYPLGTGCVMQRVRPPAVFEQLRAGP